MSLDSNVVLDLMAGPESDEDSPDQSCSDGDYTSMEDYVPDKRGASSSGSSMMSKKIEKLLKTN